MSNWVMLAKAKVLNLNFLELQKTIEDAFKMVCEPVNGVAGITVRTTSLVIGNVTYTLGVTKDTIEITFRKEGRDKKCSYIVNDGKYTYKKPQDTMATNFKTLETLNFDADVFMKIIDNLMEIALAE